MRLNLGLVAIFIVGCFSLVSCAGEVEKPALVDTKTENPLSKVDREELYKIIEKSYGELTDARTKYLQNSMFDSTFASHQADFSLSLSKLEKEGLTSEMVERLKEIQIGENKAYSAFKKLKSTCNSNSEIAKICSFEMAFYAKRAGQLITKYETPVVLPTPKQK
jgi:PBP1b-binding outer membrane lipoprotein LpoB